MVLQLDGFTADTHEKIRGRDLCKEKQAALQMLEELNIPTQLIFVATRGVNEHQIGQAVEAAAGEGLTSSRSTSSRRRTRASAAARSRTIRWTG